MEATTKGCDTYCIDLTNAGIMGHHKVYQLGDVLLRGSLAHQKPDMLKRVGGPRNKNQETNQNGTDRVDIPHHTAPDNRHSKAESVDNNVVPVIDKEYMYGRVPSV
jgi:hypothetical protein